MWWAPSPTCEDYLMHHGIKGMKWGVRRFQNKDGTLTPLGKTRYSKNIGEDIKNGYRYDREGELTREGIKKYVTPDKRYKEWLDSDVKLNNAYMFDEKWKKIQREKVTGIDSDVRLWNEYVENTPELKALSDRGWNLAKELLNDYGNASMSEMTTLMDQFYLDVEPLYIREMDRKQKRDSLTKEADDAWKKIDSKYSSERDKEKAWNKYTDDKYANFNKKLGSNIIDKIMYGKNGKGGFIRGESIDDIVDSLPENLQDSAYEYLIFMTEVDK